MERRNEKKTFKFSILYTIYFAVSVYDFLWALISTTLHYSVITLCINLLSVLSFLVHAQIFIGKLRTDTQLTCDQCYEIEYGVGELRNSRAWLWHHLAAAARIVDPNHAVGPSVWTSTARWHQGQGLEFDSLPEHKA